MPPLISKVPMTGSSNDLSESLKTSIRSVITTGPLAAILTRRNSIASMPGGPGRTPDYLGDLGGLGDFRELILPDTRGTGQSAVPADPATYRSDLLARDVEAVTGP